MKLKSEIQDGFNKVHDCMMNRLQGKIVVITGASGGLGKEIAIQSAKQGASVILLARSMDKLEVVALKC